jgi:hypothetical protein
MNNVINLFGDKDLKACSYIELDDGAIGLTSKDESISIKPAYGGLIKVSIGHSELVLPRGYIAEFLHVAALFVDSKGEHKPSEGLELVCLN